VAAITASDNHTCVLTLGGGVKCWGGNNNGQLGDNSTTNRHTPVDVSGLAGGALAITTGRAHSCAITAGGGVQCWGFNSNGQLGINSIAQQLTPVSVLGLSSGVTALTADYFHTCALTTTGAVKCWGGNYVGQLGDNSSVQRLSPIDVWGLGSGVSAITSGEQHTCALTEGGGMKCWGDNTDGQVGDGVTYGRPLPAAVLTSAIPADFNRDGKPDLLWRNGGNGATFVWHMDGTSLVSDQLIATLGPEWNVVGEGDFNADGKPDLLIRNSTSGLTFLWYMNDGNFVSDAYMFTIDPIWTIVGVADFNGDGKADIVWRNGANGATFVWYMNDTAFLSDQLIATLGAEWDVVGVGDFNVDGKPDFLIRSNVSGRTFVWYMNGGDFVSDAEAFTVDPAWKVAAVGDFNADGRPDIVFRHASTGVAYIWYMKNTTFLSDQYLFTIDPSWSIVP